MVRYFYGWTPLVLIVAVVLLFMPWLALIALMFFSLAAVVSLAALAWATVSVPDTLGRAINHRWQRRSSASPGTAAVLSPIKSDVRPIGSVPASAAVLLANSPSERET